MSSIALPILNCDTGLSTYLQKIAKFPILNEEEEHELAVKWYETQDIKSAHVLVTSHLRLVAKIALKFSGYSLPMVDIISEGNLGLMHAVKKFDPYNGSRFSTYAIWWIKAYIQDFVLKSWSLVKIGTSATKKKLFYNLNKIKNRLTNLAENKSEETTTEAIAEGLNVTHQDVVDMDNMMSNSAVSLNSMAYDDGSTEMIDLIADTSPSPEATVLENNDLAFKKNKLSKAMGSLSEREQDIIGARMLSEKPATLEVLSKKHEVSCERVRQIEAKAFNKLKTLMLQECS